MKKILLHGIGFHSTVPFHCLNKLELLVSCGTLCFQQSKRTQKNMSKKERTEKKFLFFGLVFLEDSKLG